MDEIGALFSGLFWVAIGIILIYLIVRRLKTKETENFEKRDN